jgi:cellulose synthase/poly-beta-1,6-N-acetylglucosamine synthase-like glycosyltransferase
MHLEPKTPSNLPSFSIVIETENLSTAELEGLFRCLETIQNQEPLVDAKEVLIVESGDVPSDIMKHICSEYPWISFCTIEAGTGYYEAKMKGVALTTGDVIILCDSDCIYEPNWLKNLLTPFTENPEIKVVAGEITTSASNPYGVAIALNYIFPRFSKSQELTSSSYYFCSNVAFRRDFLMQHPIPCDMPIYRGNCMIHAHNLNRQGYTIWHQPTARATHALPNGLSHFFWRFLFLGDNALAVSRLLLAKEQTVKPLQDLQSCLLIGFNKLKQLAVRVVTVFAEDWRRLIYLPLALPIALAALLLYFTGLIIGYFRPNYLLNTYNKLEAVEL